MEEIWKKYERLRENQWKKYGKNSKDIANLQICVLIQTNGYYEDK